MVADQVDERENVEMAYFVESAHGQRLAKGGFNRSNDRNEVVVLFCCQVRMFSRATHERVAACRNLLHIRWRRRLHALILSRTSQA